MKGNTENIKFKFYSKYLFVILFLILVIFLVGYSEDIIPPIIIN